jgi:ATPase subunit of ABC transporter with duplicated ATPase domains
MVSHDAELLRNAINILCHIDNGKVNIFNGEYDDYCQTIIQERFNIENELEFLAKENHKALMKEQRRAKKNKERVRNFIEPKRCLPALGNLNQSYAQKTTGKNRGLFQTRERY